MSAEDGLTSDDYAAMAQSYEENPPRRDEMVGDPYVSPSAMRMGRPRGGGEPRGASPTRALRLPARLDEALEERASNTGSTVSELMREAVTEYLDRHGVSS
ncbi:hypothetical protein AWC04_09895 [Mycolicibacterium fallax]|uniref:Uncharacterized protein n=3 Tax=Mycolicibacterium fallax TaxID=1793 RepID=A0A1X1RDT2_MYCFA|nr:hypothetical protein AWC04_09895 [Mycolicibacterium fallax]BBY99384.1 hypothetical protein MFAL_28510 [Mycolicibacterium fallax]